MWKWENGVPDIFFVIILRECYIHFLFTFIAPRQICFIELFRSPTNGNYHFSNRKLKILIISQLFFLNLINHNWLGLNAKNKCFFS
jgi:hypothetical protein